LIFILISGCARKNDFIINDKERLSNELILKVATQLKEEKKLYPCGTGGGSIDKIRMMYLAFQYYEQIEIEEARKLIIDAGDLFLKTINADERIRPYLRNYPFQPGNIELLIIFRKPDGSEVDPEKLRLVALGDDKKLRYKIVDPATDHLKTIFCETYYEAAEKLAQPMSF
jgi:hypothetical protein